jgi:hypothetical protein
VKKSESFYLHTVDGRPAYFDGEQVVFAEVHPYWEDSFETCVLRRSVDEIHADQERSARYREKRGFGRLGRYGYVVVALDLRLLPPEVAP